MFRRSYVRLAVTSVPALSLLSTEEEEGTKGLWCV